MQIKRLKTLRVNSYTFKIKWDSSHDCAKFSYRNLLIEIGTEGEDDAIFDRICHELMEIVAVEMNLRLSRPDCSTDYIFVYDHRQHDTMVNMFAGLLSQFLK